MPSLGVGRLLATVSIHGAEAVMRPPVWPIGQLTPTSKKHTMQPIALNTTIKPEKRVHSGAERMLTEPHSIAPRGSGPISIGCGRLGRRGGWLTRPI